MRIGAASANLFFFSETSLALRKFLVIIVLIPLLGAGVCGNFREQALPDYGPAYREYAYVTNGKSNTVSVIDLRTFELAKTILWVRDRLAWRRTARRMKFTWSMRVNNVTSLMRRKNAVVATIGFMGSLTILMFLKTASGRTWLTRLLPMFRDRCGEAGCDRQCWRGAAPGLARVSPDGGTIVVSNRGDNTVSLIDAKALRVRSAVPVCQEPEDIAILHDSSKAFVYFVQVRHRWLRLISRRIACWLCLM